MTETSYSNDLDFYSEKSFMTEDNYDRETIDNSFNSNYKHTDAPAFIDKNDRKKNSISFLKTNNICFFDKQQINEQSLKRKSENIQESVIGLLENIGKGPNVNIKMPKKTFNSKEEREFFKKLIVNKQKTELCKNWVLYNDCYYKETCSFAHGEKDLRRTSNPVNYKTKTCKAFAEKFFCTYGNRCHYSHNVREKKTLNYKKILEQLALDYQKLILTKGNCDLESILNIIQNKRKIKTPRLNVFESIVERRVEN